MTKYIGICHSIDWNMVIKEIENTVPSYIGPSHKEGDDLPGLDQVIDLWKRGGIKTVNNGGTIAWDMFISGKSFDNSIAEKFCEFVGIESYNSCWISRIQPGTMTGWHWDVNDDEYILSKRKDIRRFHCHIGMPSHGHILIVEDQCFYNQEQGTVYEWPSRTSWHVGINSGLVSKYLFNIW